MWGQEREREEGCDHSETKRNTQCRVIGLRQQQSAPIPADTEVTSIHPELKN
jgi:hypothetical protein